MDEGGRGRQTRDELYSARADWTVEFGARSRAHVSFRLFP